MSNFPAFWTILYARIDENLIKENYNFFKKKVNATINQNNVYYDVALSLCVYLRDVIK